MTVSSWPYVAQDTTDIEYGYLFREFKGDGVVGSIGDTLLKPTGDSTGLQIKLSIGSAILRGYMVKSTAIEIIPLANTPHATLARVDRAIAELNLSAPTIPQRVVFKTIAGVAGSTTPPALTQTDTGIYQISLGTINVGAGATTLSAANVVDDRSWVSNEVGAWTSDAKRPSTPRKSQIGFNDSRGYFEYYTGSAWAAIADWASIANKPTTFAPAAHSHVQSDITGLGPALGALAPLANPTFTGTVTAPAFTGNITGRINGIQISVGATAPANPVNGDLWFNA